jgi:hypothetical protein
MTLLLSTLFFLMIVAPCVVALRSAHKSDENDAQAEVERHEFQAVTALPEKAKATSARPRTLREMATEAEAEARAAHEVARKAHRVALAADAKAAKLRADVAAEAAVEAGREAQKPSKPLWTANTCPPLILRSTFLPPAWFAGVPLRAEPLPE